MNQESFNKILGCRLSGSLSDWNDQLSLEELVKEGLDTSRDLEVYKKGMAFIIGALDNNTSYLLQLLEKDRISK